MLSRPEGNKLRGSLPVHENERCVFFLKNKTSWLKKSPKERVVQLWHLVCIGGGVIVCLAAVLMWSGYFTAKHKYQTEATLTDIKVTSHKRLKSKEERSRDPFHQYETYYKYTLTWQFMDPDTEKKYTFVRDDEANNPHAHKYGEKITLFIYYNDNPDEFETIDPFISVIVGIAGLAIIIFPVVDIIRAYIKRRRIILRDQKAAAARAANGGNMKGS